MKCNRRQSRTRNSAKVAWFMAKSHNQQLKLFIAILVTISGSCWQQKLVHPQTIPSYVLPDDTYSQDIYRQAQSTTVRIVRPNTSGSGVIIRQQGNIYTVLTNWHVVATNDILNILTVDGQAHVLLQEPQQLHDLDLAIVQFQSLDRYPIATTTKNTPQPGEKVYAAGFPLYDGDRTSNTIALGIQAFRLTQGEVSLIPFKSLSQGYSLGYTNDIEAGMSGGPIFNTQGLLIGINGRQKYAEPDFGAYIFEDGSEPPPEILEKMVNSSWGIPITSYLQFAPQASQTE
ncbi:serine protease [Myxosarcina sp. GI1]|uniref:S1 family peptidase n=1 Tax=Myxosarcina sp. GI1 TaxID=1541065 RepID=UPI0009DDE581|nr:serine protease [Myxosarcina sp. GI1]